MRGVHESGTRVAAAILMRVRSLSPIQESTHRVCTEL